MMANKALERMRAGPRQLPMRTRWAARIAQLQRLGVYFPRQTLTGWVEKRAELLIALLEEKRLPVTLNKNGCQVQMPGFHALRNNVILRVRTLRCEFENAVLTCLRINAES